MLSVDINCDMGEGCGNDAELMKHVSSVNIACGFHAGDDETMRRTVEIAVENGVAIGAHPSFRDRQGFGRNAANLPLPDLFDIVAEQIGTLRKICVAAGGELSHVKPHGALYNQAAKDADLARTIAKAVRSIDVNLILFGLSGSFSISEANDAGLRTACEGFADRTYRPDGSLTPRREPNALIHEAETAAFQVLEMVKSQRVTATDGTTVPIVAETVCIHGDHANALQMVIAIRRKLSENGIMITALHG